MQITTCQFLGSLLIMAFFTSCSRPVAYFQPSMSDYRVAKTSQSTSLNVAQTRVDHNPVVLSSTIQQPTQMNSSLGEVDAQVRNSSGLVATKTSQKRLNRIRSLVNTTQASVAAIAPKKMNLMERIMLKKMNRKISKQLAPTNPERTLASESILILGAALAVGGILLLAFTSGGGFALGAIALAAGLVILLIELL